MHPVNSRSRSSSALRRGLLAVSCAALLLPGQSAVLAQGAAPAAAPAPAPAAEKVPPEQLDALIAPIALYPDPLLAQTLVAATYPLEIIQLQQWLLKNPGLKDKALADAVATQPWDPAVQSMAAVPEVVKRLADDIQWTTDLGNAFLAYQSDVMDAAQRMRKKALDKGTLAANEQQKVETQLVGDKTIIVVESSDPEVIYVPSYSPTVVYGASMYYPYPPIYYPPYYPGGAYLAFGVGVIIGGAWGGYCCGMGWGHNDIDINIDNNFNRIEHNRVGGGGSGNNKWQHNAQHRGAAPYADKATASKFGGAARGDSPASRQARAGQPLSGGGMDRSAQPGLSDRSTGASMSDRSAGGSLGGNPGMSTMDRGGGSADRIGSYSPSSSNRASTGGFGGSSSGFSGDSARMSSSRGASSFGGRGGGGRRR